MQINGAGIVVETLINHGITDVFGYPGGAVLDLYDALYKNSDRIKHFITAHEQGAAHAADGYARATGKTGVVIATSGPGATNLVTGIATAFLDSTPLVAITGNVPLPLIGKDSFQEVDIAGITMPITKHNFIVKSVCEIEDILCEAFQIATSGRPGPVLVDIPKNIQVMACEFRGGKPLPLIGKDSFQEVDIAGITMPITKHNYIVKSVCELEDILCEAFQIATSGRPGPVLVDIPKNIQAATCEFRGGKPLSLLPQPTADDEKIAEIAEIIDSAKRPYIYCGGGVVISNIADKLMEFAEKINAPIGCSMMGLSAVNSNSPLALGMTGMHGTYAASKIKSDADVIIGVGIRFSDRATGDKVAYKQNAKIIHIDIDDAEIDKNIIANCSLVGDLRVVLPKLTELVKPKQCEEWNKTAHEYKQFAGHKYKKEGFNPRNIIKAARKYAAPDTVVATDVGQHQMWVAQHYRLEKPRTLLTSGGLGTMGFGLGAANGAAVAGDKKTILFTGDGSFHMNLNEIATAVRYNLPVVIVLLNNSVLGMVRQWQGLFYENRFSQTTLDRPTDYKKLTEAFGAEGHNATSLSELEVALDAAFASSKPVLINCVIDKDEKVFPMIPPGKATTDMIID